MSIFDKTRYLRTLFILLPIGIGFAYWGIDGLTKKVEDLPCTKGIISEVKMGSYYYETCKCNLPTLFIYLENTKAPFITKISKHIEILKASKIEEGDRIEVWTWDKTDDNRIKQVNINGNIIIHYNRTIDLYLVFLVVGLGLVVLCIFYVLNSSEDLFGKKNYDDKKS